MHSSAFNKHYQGNYRRKTKTPGRWPTPKQALHRVVDEEYGPYHMGTRGTPQGAVLSPVYFSITMLYLPRRLAKVRSLAQRCNYRAQCAAPLICKKSGTTCTCSPPRNFAQLCPK
uniref:Uncharacterized protein n=1 Tax=Rhipicephalus zambeziensis TaxID=60191 RepID=A0A224YT73_9ACAR